MGHQHQWQTEPPEGHLYFNKTFDQRYADEEDLATNSMLTSPGEICPTYIQDMPEIRASFAQGMGIQIEKVGQNVAGEGA